MSNGYVALLIGMVVGTVTAFMASRLLAGQPPIVREPIAQGVAFFLAWLSVWPWAKRQPRFAETSRLRVVNHVRNAGFLGYAAWIAIGAGIIVAVRLYLKTG